MIKFFLKFDKKFDNNSINSRNYATADHQTLEEVPRTLVPEKNRKFQQLEKIAGCLKLLKFVIIKIED